MEHFEWLYSGVWERKKGWRRQMIAEKTNETENRVGKTQEGNRISVTENTTKRSTLSS